ncbi:proline hydroxylase [Planctomycetaceae bacterium SCGC AG-212-F19]|nr:proline hydroxylase [Planctomycetaceae bacterium SCGC AG-212-F19]
MARYSLSEEQVRRFHDDGYVIVPRLFDDEELDLLRRIARTDRGLAERAAGRRDGQGTVVKLTVENELRDDIYGAIVRSRRIVDAMERLLGGEVYHYHHKMILKEPFVGGAWEWHQDYGYWYHNGCLYPHLASCMIAVDPATRANGCLQVLRGSHHLGRIEHGKVGDQTGADPERVGAALDRLELVHCELPAGAAVLFHCNTLHCSGANSSPNPRWALICCYNRASNDPYKDSRHPRYSPLEKWPDERVMEVGCRQFARLTEPLAQPIGAAS